jgi:hypothetical protein
MTYQDWTGAQNGPGSMSLFKMMRWLVAGTQRKGSLNGVRSSELGHDKRNISFGVHGDLYTTNVRAPNFYVLYLLRSRYLTADAFV